MNKLKVFLFALHPVEEFSFIGESQGICSISGFLKSRYGNEILINIYDQQFVSIEDFVNIVLKYKPMLIGISIKMFTFNQFEFLYSLLEEKVFPIFIPTIVVGNSTAHFSGVDILHMHHNVIVSLGEGEISFSDLIEYISGRIKLESVRNIIYIKNDKICYSKYEYLDRNLIPIADRRNSKRFYNLGGEIYIEGSRGCAYCGCSICECKDFLGSRVCALKWRDRPIESIIDEMKILQGLSIKSVTFSDEDFCGDDTHGLRRAFLLSQEIIKRGIKIEFRINARVRTLFSKEDSPDILELKFNTFVALKKAGLTKVFLGFESGSPSQLKRYNKGFLLFEFLEAKRILTKIGIDFELGYISLDPLMNLEELEESLVFVSRFRCIPYISSIYKELRIQKGNRSYKKLVENFEKAHNMQILGDVLFHDQIYNVIRYADSRVDIFRKLMRVYEQKTYKIYYYLRILTQYSLGDQLKDCLISSVYETIELLKWNDYYLMVGLLQELKHLNNSIGTLNSIMNFHQEKRREIYSSLVRKLSGSKIPKFMKFEKLYYETDFT